MKRKLTNHDILNICNSYISNGITMEELAKEYNCSPSHISKCIHRAIILRYSQWVYGNKN